MRLADLRRLTAQLKHDFSRQVGPRNQRPAALLFKASPDPLSPILTNITLNLTLLLFKDWWLQLRNPTLTHGLAVARDPNPKPDLKFRIHLTLA